MKTALLVTITALTLSFTSGCISVSRETGPDRTTVSTQTTSTTTPATRTTTVSTY